MLMNSIPFIQVLWRKNENRLYLDGEILKKLGYYFLLCSFSLYIMSFSQDLRIDTIEDEDFMVEAEDGEDLSIIQGERNN